mmetsp:Transcript_1990/g.6492  ORF Transcript_1990/g.6492 Transcript_1990/m.6492 type:complete len:401 (-) Transcript_1990:204-1406(-)
MDSGRNVMSAFGFGGPEFGGRRISHALHTMPSNNTLSSMANPVPIQTRAPPPKGKYASLGPKLFNASRASAPSEYGLCTNHRSGLNATGSFQYFGSRWIKYGATSTVVPFVTRTPGRSSTSLAAHRPTMYAGGRMRSVSSTHASVYGSLLKSPASSVDPVTLLRSTSRTSSAMRSPTFGCSATSAHAHESKIALVSCPATMSVMSSSRSALSVMPPPSPTPSTLPSPSSVARNNRSSKSKLSCSSPRAVARRRLAMIPYTSSSNLFTASLYRTLSNVGAHSGIIIPVAARRPKNSKLSFIARLIVAALAPSTSAPNNARATISNVASLKSAYTSLTPRLDQSRAIIFAPTSTMHFAYVSTAALRNAGLLNRRCLAHVSPSLTNNPFPASDDPGKNAVPSF